MTSPFVPPLMTLVGAAAVAWLVWIVLAVWVWRDWWRRGR